MNPIAWNRQVDWRRIQIPFGSSMIPHVPPLFFIVLEPFYRRRANFKTIPRTVYTQIENQASGDRSIRGGFFLIWVGFLWVLDIEIWIEWNSWVLIFDYVIFSLLLVTVFDFYMFSWQNIHHGKVIFYNVKWIILSKDVKDVFEINVWFPILL